MTDIIDVRNPRTGERDYSICVADSATIAPLAIELRGNQAAWRDAGLDARIAVLTAWQEKIAEQREDIVAALGRDTGRRKIADGEVSGLLSGIERWCNDAPGIVASAERASKIIPQVAIRERLAPYPLLGVISPWNFPLLLSFIDAVPALLAGCAVIIKPSEVTPRFAEPVGRTIAQVPELHGVLRFVAGDGRSGAALIEHVDVVAFTGSVATGRKVAAAAAAAFIPAFLELGGKDPVIVLPGSDLERATTSILRASVAATGQACQSLERIYVHASERDAFVAKLKDKAEKAALTYPDPQDGIIGPLIFARQADTIRAHLDDAVAKGATIVTGGDVEELGGGYWIRPTVLIDVDHSMQIMNDETFGPVMPVMAYASEDEAIALANDSRYGLSGAVFGPTEDDALRVAAKLEVGGVSVNDAGMTTMIFEASKSAFKQSGMGPSRMGPSGMTRFFRHQALYINRGDVVPIEAMAERSSSEKEPKE
ncbi:MAG: aldehyde dehydrogenase family protein [Woeseiaceae bacterium]|nr:aldehyde dehydrogenase family protein [Woeseiaceae bacterium]